MGNPVVLTPVREVGATKGGRVTAKNKRDTKGQSCSKMPRLGYDVVLSFAICIGA